LEVIPVPTNKPIARIDHTDLIFQNERGKFAAIIERVKEVHEKGQPILIGTASIESNERLSSALTAAGVTHTMLNAKNHEREGEIIAEAGKIGAVTLATNMAGRGVDIKLGGPEASPDEVEKVKSLGGLFVLGTERHEARRIDNQLRGRAGRQGDPGETQFYVSMDDALMRVFGGDRVKALMGTFKIPEDQPIQMKMLANSLEGAQTRIEGFHFDARKQVLAYDDVLNLQRKAVYARRHKLLSEDREEVSIMMDEVQNVAPDGGVAFNAKRAEFGEEIFYNLFRRFALQMIDTLWVEHLEVMSYTRNSVNLRAYGQRDPLIEYRKEGTRLFKEMQAAVLDRINEIIPRLQPVLVDKEEAEKKKESEAAQAAAGTTEEGKSSAKSPVRNTVVYGRNDLVTITNGAVTETVKYKKAEPLLAQGYSIVEDAK
jgi:preprotein translocase subunit SecA